MPDKKSTTTKIRAIVAESGNISLVKHVVGLALLALWAVFLVGEYFGLVQHPEAFSWEHMLTKWSPLVVGLAIFAPEVLDKVAGLPAMLKGWRIIKKGD